MLSYEKAINFAVEAHRGQQRKGDSLPYIIHPLTVGIVLLEEGCEQEVVIAGFLHDTVEDTDVTYAEIEDNFGSRVMRIVRGVSEPDKTLPWRRRKEHTIEYIRRAPLDERMVICADKLHNITSMIDEYRESGEKLWERFNAGREEQKWYYREILKSLQSHNDIPEKVNIFKELEKRVGLFEVLIN